MKIRTALVLACFVLSALPLGVIVFYSYFSSRRALERVYHAQATRLTAEMDRRLGDIRDTLQQRLAEVSALPDLPKAGEQPDTVLMAIGDIAPMVHSLEIQPTPAPDPPAPAAPGAASSVVIHVPPPPQMPRGFSDADRAELHKMIDLSSELGTRWSELSDKQRTDLQKQINDAQKTFSERLARRTTTRITRHVEKSIRDQEDLSPMIFGEHLNMPVRLHGKVVGRVHAELSASEVIRRILGTNADNSGEITFAVDRQGHVYTRTQHDRAALDGAGITQRAAAAKPLNAIANWVVVMRQDPLSGLRVGVAKPFGEDFEELRKTAAKNFGYGMGLLALALIGILPVANHISRDVEVVTRGAERIAQGDLTTRLPVRSNNEVGHLATAFNRMAQDLSVQQQRIVEQERAAVEYQRKSAELEEARHFQLSMLPKEVPRHPRYDIAVFTHTAAEVGGDYYDFHVEDGGVMSVTIGDATGHGARAGTMVAVIKALFAGYSSEQSPAEFLREATAKVRRMDLERMAMALQLARFTDDGVTLASAGMPPAHLHRCATGAVEEITLGATPLGTLGAEYHEVTVALEPGDTLLFMSDGFPELMNAAHQQLGYTAAAEAFGAAAKSREAEAVISALAAAVRAWHGDEAPDDDVTFVVVRARGADRSSFA